VNWELLGLGLSFGIPKLTLYIQLFQKDCSLSPHNAAAKYTALRFETGRHIKFSKLADPENHFNSDVRTIKQSTSCN
jgi:hypothetical protein